jgi:hypothetical protein
MVAGSMTTLSGVLRANPNRLSATTDDVFFLPNKRSKVVVFVAVTFSLTSGCCVYMTSWNDVGHAPFRRAAVAVSDTRK